MIILANELYLEYDGTRIACTTDFALNIDKEVIQSICSGWATNNGSTKSWSLDFTAIDKRNDPNNYILYPDLFNSLNDTNEPLNVGLKSTIATDNNFTGRALLTNLTRTGTVDDAVRYSGVLTGYGALNIVSGEVSDVLPYTLPFSL